MELTWPWGLASLLPVAVAAAWALRRPLQHVVPVSTLRLWRQALEALGPAAVSSARRVTAAWAVLLAGAAAGGVALSRPVWHVRRPARTLALAVYPAAELAPPGLAGGLPDALARSAGALLDRLAPADRVRLILPTVMGGASDLLSPGEAGRRLRRVPCLPVPGEALALPAGQDDAQHLYRFAPATMTFHDGPGCTTIALPARPGEVTLDAFGVGPLGGGEVQVFAAVRNHTSGRKRGTVLLAREDGQAVGLAYDLPPNARGSVHADLPGGGAYYSATIAGVAGAGARAFAVRRRAAFATVAMIGRDDPLVRRFVRINPALRLTGDPAEADLVIAIGSPAPGTKAALVIDPPAPPPPFKVAATVSNLALRDADALRDHPVMSRGGHGVDLAAVAVRKAAGWQAPPGAAAKRLLAIGDSALILAADDPRRVYVSFDLAAENTNFALTESFVVFLANVTAYLAPQARGSARYAFVSPLQAGGGRDWQPLRPPTTAPTTRLPPLPECGLYRDAGGELHAVNLLALRSASPQTDPVALAAAAPLPTPRPAADPRELWPVLAAIAAGLWLAGWTLRALR